MAGIQQWIIGLLMVGLFSFAIIGYAINFADDNDAVVDISDDSQILGVKSGIEGNLSSSSEGAASAYTSITNISIGSGSQTTQTPGLFTSSLNPTSAIGVVKNIFLVGFVRVFGTNSGFGIFSIVFMSILTIITLAMIWKAWVGGQTN